MKLGLWLVCFGLWLVPGMSFAEWRHARGTSARDARSSYGIDFTVPEVAWKLYLGGSMGPHQLLPGSADAAGLPTAILVAAGRVEKRRMDDALIWKSQGLVASRLLGRFDADGDGTTECWVLGALPAGDPAVFALDPTTGEILWNTPAGSVGVLRDTARIVDIEGDGFLELYIADAGSNLPGSLSYAAHLYGFKGGFDQAVKRWTLSMSPGRDYYASLNDAFGDFDGDGNLELLAQGLKHVYIYSGLTGKLMGASGETGNMAAARSVVVVKDLDQDGSDEAITFSPGGWSESINALRVAVFSWDETSEKPLLLWERSALDPQNHRMAFDVTSLSNLDEDAGWEIAVSFDEGEGWVTEILDALTGTLKTTIPGKRFEATMDVDGLGSTEIVTYDKGSPVEIHALSGGELTPVATLPDWQLLSCRSPATSYSTALASRPCRFGSEEAVPGWLFGQLDDELLVENFQAVTIDGGEYTVVGTYALTGGLRFLTQALWVDAGGTSRFVGLASSGRLILFDQTLSPLNYFPDSEQPVLGLKVRNLDAGYGNLKGYPIAADLTDAPGEELVYVTSDSRAVVVNTSQATVAGNVQPFWSSPRAQAVVMGTGKDGQKRVVTIGKERITGLSSAGDTLWTYDAFQPEMGGIFRYGDVVTTRLGQDAHHTVVTQTRDSKSGDHHLLALNLDDGTVRYHTLVDTNNSGMRRLLTTRDNQTGTSQLMGGLPSALWAFDSEDGASSIIAPAELGVYGVAMDPDGDGIDDVLAVNRESLQLISAQGDVVWTQELPTLKPVLGTLVSCDGKLGYVSSQATSGRLWHRDILSGELLWEYVLAGGELWLEEGLAETFGHQIGALGNAASAVDEAGNPLVFVGAATGLLYAVEACTGEVVWYLDLGTPIREVIVADWDGDGKAELVVSSVDGHLYGVNHQKMAAPEHVLDIDPPRDITDTDVDDIETFDTLFALWPPVDGASSYAVAVYTNDGQLVTSGYETVGSNTSATLTGLNLALGRRYRVAVVAEGAGGQSSSRLSDGVTVIDVSPPEVTLGINPTSFVAGEDAEIHYSATDKTALKSVDVTVFSNPITSVTEVVHKSDLHVQTQTASFAWNGSSDTGSLQPGVYELRITALDHAGHEVTHAVEFEVLEGSSPEVTEVEKGSDVIEADPVVDELPGQDVAGCTCQSSRAPGRLPILFVLIFFLFYRRHRHHALCSGVHPSE